MNESETSELVDALIRGSPVPIRFTLDVLAENASIRLIFVSSLFKNEIFNLSAYLIVRMFNYHVLLNNFVHLLCTFTSQLLYFVLL